MLLWGCLCVASFGLHLEPSREILSAEVVAVGLEEPMGMAFDPAHTVLYVAERRANRITKIEHRENAAVVENRFKLVRSIPAWAVPSQQKKKELFIPQLNQPQDIAFGSDGSCFVVEGGENGRLLKFDPLTDGLKQACIIPTPWMLGRFCYTSVALDKHNRLYVSSQDVDKKAILAYGSVMMREPDGNWWMIDHSPFAEFANVAIQGDTLVVGENRMADISWYDADRQLEIGGMRRLEGLRYVTILADGTVLGGIERDNGTWSIVEIDPLHKAVWEWAGGLTEIGGLHGHPVDGDVYVSLMKEGKIMRFRRMDPPVGEKKINKIDALTHAFELEKALPPNEWPAFFRTFIEKLGVVKAVNQHGEGNGEGKDAASTGSEVPMTFDEFTRHLPVVAAKMKARLVSPSELEPDPIEEVSFLIFYPNKVAITQNTMAPSVSLFRAVRKSGKVIRTRFLPNKTGIDIDESMSWEDMPEMLVSFPSGYFAPETDLAEEGLVRAYFLGMGLGPDYWIDIQRIDKEKSLMRVEYPFGNKVEYALESYQESLSAGEESVLVAGLKAIDKGWYQVGRKPIMWHVVGYAEEVPSFKHGMPLVRAAKENVTINPSRASSSKDAFNRELDLCRKVILRAASRWKEEGF